MIVLLADDEAVVLKIATRLLQFLGHEVVPASDGGQALALLESRSDIDMAILDQNMPEHTGLEVVALIREKRPNIRVFISSGDSELQTSDPLVSHLKKPYRLEALEERLAEVAASL